MFKHELCKQSNAEQYCSISKETFSSIRVSAVNYGGPQGTPIHTVKMCAFSFVGSAATDTTGLRFVEMKPVP